MVRGILVYRRNAAMTLQEDDIGLGFSSDFARAGPEKRRSEWDAEIWWGKIFSFLCTFLPSRLPRSGAPAHQRTGEFVSDSRILQQPARSEAKRIGVQRLRPRSHKGGSKFVELARFLR